MDCCHPTTGCYSHANSIWNLHDMSEPCPFCTSTRFKVVEVDLRVWMVECMDCHATGPLCQSAESAKVRWNRRGRNTERYAEIGHERLANKTLETQAATLGECGEALNC